MHKIFTTVFCFCICFHLLNAQTYRYTEQIFPASLATNNVVYGTAPFLNAPYINENSTTTGNLVMDIYQPQGDTLTKRPAIIFAHSGAFITGNRMHDDMVAFCDSFARMGYVTATIDYRQGMYLVSNVDIHSARSAYRGLQDGRSAVRYLRANATQYGIDPTRIYMAGTSAGAFISLHSIYMDKPSEKPINAGPVSYGTFPFNFSGPDLGDYDIGQNLDHDGTPEAVIGLWGALYDTAIVELDNTEAVFMAHGTADGTVPFISGSPFGVSLFPAVYGSHLIRNKLNYLGIPPQETYFLTGEDHEFHGTSNGTWVNGIGGNTFWDTLVDKSKVFLWKQHKPTAAFSAAPAGLTVQFTDNTPNITARIWSFGDGNVSTSANPLHTYSGNGTYQVNLYVQNACLSWDTITEPVTVFANLPLSWTVPLEAKKINGNAVLSWSVTNQVQTEHFEITHSRNGVDFSPIGTVKASLFQESEERFMFIHKSPQTGKNYYRIRQYDIDGKSSLSNITSLKIESKSYSVFPNPTHAILNIVQEKSEPMELQIYNRNGKLVRSFSISNQQSKIDVSDLIAGVYFLKQEGVDSSVQFVVQH